MKSWPGSQSVFRKEPTGPWSKGPAPACELARLAGLLRQCSGLIAVAQKNQERGVLGAIITEFQIAAVSMKERRLIVFWLRLGVGPWVSWQERPTPRSKKRLIITYLS